MSIYKLHWLFKERYNKHSTNHYRDYSPMQIDQLLNNAMFQILEEHFTNEGNLQRLDLFSNLLVTYPEQTTIVPENLGNNIYRVKLNTLEYNYLHFERAWVNSDCGIVKLEIVPSRRLNDVLNDEFQKPSKKWKRLVGNIVKDGDESSLLIYSEEGFTLTGINIEYLRKPKPVFYGGYNTPEYKQCVAQSGTNCATYYNTTSPIQNCELNETYHTLIVDYAVEEAMRILKDQSISLQMEKINSTI